MTKDEISQAFNEGYTKGYQACKKALQPDRTGLTYYRIDACKAQDAYSADCICWTPKQPESVVKESLPTQKPLSDEEIENIWEITQVADVHDFARAIEKAHGIKHD